MPVGFEDPDECGAFASECDAVAAAYSQPFCDGFRSRIDCLRPLEPPEEGDVDMLGMAPRQRRVDMAAASSISPRSDTRTAVKKMQLF